MEGLEKIESQPLIKGCFQPEEAQEILSNLFQSKIQYHSIAGLSIQERTGVKDDYHRKRITELSNSLNYFLEVIKKQSDSNLVFVIECDIKMRMQINQLVSGNV